MMKKLLRSPCPVMLIFIMTLTSCDNGSSSPAVLNPDAAAGVTPPATALMSNEAYKLVDGRMPIFDDLFSNLSENPGVSGHIDEDLYNQLFSERGNQFVGPNAPANPPFSNVHGGNNQAVGKEVTAYKHFKTAVNFLYTRGGIYSKLFSEGTGDDIKRELAAIAAHVWQETKGFSFNVEQGYHPLYDTYSDNGDHGRGPKQLSYGFNYRPVSRFIFGDQSVLLIGGKFNYRGKDDEIGPGAIAVDGRMAWLASLWFFLEPQGSKPSMHDVLIAAKGTFFVGKVAGFGLTTSIINGGIECTGTTESGQSAHRIRYDNDFLKLAGVSDDREKGCSPSVGVGRFWS